jgi:triacylglycerol lipase
MTISWITEMIYLVLYGISSFAGFIFSVTSVAKKSQKKKTVVFIHGWLGGNPVFFFLKHALEQKGIRVYMTNFGWLTRDITKSAEKLKEYIETHKLQDVVLVGASLGGIIAYTYVQQFKGWEKVSALVTIGTPFHGSSPAAYLGFLSTSARQVSPDSSFLRKLKNQSLLHPDRVYSISAKKDEFVPPESAHLAGAKNIVTCDVGHVALQAFSNEVKETITSLC